MNIIVTGCSGFIGARVCEMLVDQGHNVYGIDNLDDSYSISLKEWRLNRLTGNDNFRFYRTDITNGNSLKNAFDDITDIPDGNGIDAVINLAAKAGVRRSIDQPEIYYETNLSGVLNLLELCREFDIQKFVQASTSSVYGKNEIPFREDQRTDRQISPYASSKKAAELLCYTYHSLYGIDFTILRYFTVYGPAGRPDMSPFRFIRWCAEEEEVTVYGDGNQSRDFTYIDDIATGTVYGLKNLGFEIINLGSNKPIRLSEFLDIIRKYTKSRSGIVYYPVNPADVPATWADISKAHDLLGWTPGFSLENGIYNSVDWYLQNRTWAKKIPL